MQISENCFLNEELRSELTSNAINEGYCEVCGVKGRLMDFSEFYPFFNALLSLFEVSNNGNKTIADIVQDEWHIFKNKKVAKYFLTDVISNSAINYNIDSIVDYTSDIQERISVWDRIKKSVKEDSRFFTNIDELVTYDYLNCGDNGLVIGDQLYRSRIIPHGHDVLSCEEMGCPPRVTAPAGRANPIGIPYLYLCDKPETTYYEVRAVYLDKLCVGTFEILQDLKIVDFIHNISLYNCFIDDITPFKETIIKKKVIEAISSDLSKPLRRYDSELEYVPTQLICEYCKQVVCADGITFESSLHKNAQNYVLFDEGSVKCTNVEIHEISNIIIGRN